MLADWRARLWELGQRTLDDHWYLLGWALLLGYVHLALVLATSFVSESVGWILLRLALAAALGGAVVGALGAAYLEADRHAE